MKRTAIIFCACLFLTGLSIILLITYDFIVTPAGRVPLGTIGAYLMANGLKPFAEILIKKLKQKN